MTNSGLRDFIRTVIAELPEGQPEDIAAEVAARTPEELRFTWYAEALRRVVADVMRNDRNFALNAALADEPAPELDNALSNSEPSRRAPTPSKKTARARSWWASMKDSRVRVERGHVRLGSCGRDDLKYLIANRNRLVTDVLGQISNYQRLLDLLDECDVQTVDELPEQEAA